MFWKKRPIVLLIVLIVAAFAMPSDLMPQTAKGVSVPDAEEASFFVIINDNRSASTQAWDPAIGQWVAIPKGSLAQLAWSQALLTASESHSQDMATHDFFNHTSSDGQSPEDRMRAAGYAYSTYLGENIAAGFGTASSVFNAWYNSEEHRKNILNKDYVAIGVGRAYNVSSTYGWYWTVDFGGYNDSAKSLSVQLTSPANGATVTSSPVKLVARVTFNGSSIAGAMVNCYVDGIRVGTAASNATGYATFAYASSAGSHNWYVAADMSGYATGASATWGFTYAPPTPPLAVQLITPVNGAAITASPIKLVARVTSNGALISAAAVKFYVDGNNAGTASSNSTGYATLSYSPSAGARSWYAGADKTGFVSGASPAWSFTYSPPLAVRLVSPANGASVNSSPIYLVALVTSGGSAVSSATVKFYVYNGILAGTATSNATGYAKLSCSPSSGAHRWNATADKAGYSPGTSPTWAFTYAPPKFDFSLGVSPANASAIQGGIANATVTAALLNGTAQPVSLSASVSPETPTISVRLSAVGGSPPFRSSLTVATADTAPAGTYTITITGTAGTNNLTRSASFKVTVTSSSKFVGVKALQISVVTDKTSYRANSPVHLRIKVTDASTGMGVAGATVTITLTKPDGTTSAKALTTDSNGAISTSLKIGRKDPVGTYGVRADASAPGYDQASGSTSFQVR